MDDIQVRQLLINRPEDLVSELLEGYCRVWERFIVLSKEQFVTRREPKQAGKVALVIGNGLGHEPAMLGLVGKGLFDLNVPGDLFAAPGAGRLAVGARVADRRAGVLLCVSNHSGDVLAAEMALELLPEGSPEVRVLRLFDDISTSPTHDQERRGGPGLLFAWKILGAAAEAGYGLEQCEDLGIRTRGRIRSLSAVLAGTRNPLNGQAVSPVPAGSVLVGTGVHGEGTGITLEGPSADELAIHLVERLARDLGLKRGDRCGLLLNDAGALSIVELSLLGRRALSWLSGEGIVVERTWMGHYATTLATAGVGMALCAFDDELLDLWDAPCESPSLASQGNGPVG